MIGFNQLSKIVNRNLIVRASTCCKRCLETRTIDSDHSNSYDVFNANYAELMTVTPSEFAFKSNPDDLENDLYNQLAIGPVSGVGNGFTLPLNRWYQVVRRSPTDHETIITVLERIKKWNPEFRYLLRMSFFLRILTSRFDQIFALHIDEMQILADSVIQTLPTRREKIERRLDQILSGRRTSSSTHADLHHLVLKSRDLLTSYEAPDFQYLINWMMLYLDNAIEQQHLPKYERCIDDQLLYKTGDLVPPYVLHLGTIKALNLNENELAKINRRKLRFMSHDRDLAGYLHCYINLCPDPKEPDFARMKFAAVLMRIRLQFLTEEVQEEAPTKRYSRGDYYESYKQILEMLPGFPLLDYIPDTEMRCNLAINKMQTFSFQ